MTNQSDFDRHLETLNTKDRWSKKATSGRDYLYKEIQESEKPFVFVKALVQYCTFKPCQDKILNGAIVLSKDPTLLIDFIEQEDHNYFGEIDSDRTWLYRISMEEIFKAPLGVRKRFIKVACEWLKNEDFCIREDAVRALEGLYATEAIEALEEAIKTEKDKGVKDIMKEGLLELKQIEKKDS